MQLNNKLKNIFLKSAPRQNATLGTVCGRKGIRPVKTYCRSPQTSNGHVAIKVGGHTYYWLLCAVTR